MAGGTSVIRKSTVILLAASAGPEAAEARAQQRTSVLTGR